MQKFKLTPQSSLNSEIRGETTKLTKTPLLSSKINRDMIKDYLKGKINPSEESHSNENESKIRDKKFALDLSKVKQEL